MTCRSTNDDPQPASSFEPQQQPEKDRVVLVSSCWCLCRRLGPPRQHRCSTKISLAILVGEESCVFTNQHNSSFWPADQDEEPQKLSPLAGYGKMMIESSPKWEAMMEETTIITTMRRRRLREQANKKGRRYGIDLGSCCSFVLPCRVNGEHIQNGASYRRTIGKQPKLPFGKHHRVVAGGGGTSYYDKN
mmetsp:Transcript_40348/g.83982  ORF Transcript_40348/g.83982 Transcript_40348/m.83982 type:complete len:190 (-) Transcript_40348:14-583(-)